jgi:hypothetical protein
MRTRRRLRAVCAHVVVVAAHEQQPAPRSAAGEQPPAAENWAPTAAHGFIPYAVTAADRELFAERGYLTLPPILAPEALDALLDEVQAQWDEVKRGHDAGEGTWLQAGLLPNIHHLSPRCRDVYWRGPVVAVARALIGANVKAVTSQLTFKMPGMHQGVDWHQDNGCEYPRSFGPCLPRRGVRWPLGADPAPRRWPPVPAHEPQLLDRARRCALRQRAGASRRGQPSGWAARPRRWHRPRRRRRRRRNRRSGTG